MKIIKLLKNFTYRIIEKKEVIIMAAIIIPLMVAISAMLFSQKPNLKSKVAFVTYEHVTFPENDKLQIDVVSARPDTAELLLGNYDYIVEKKTDNTYTVTTGLKNRHDTELVEQFFNYGGSLKDYGNKDNERNVASSIIGTIIMVVIMQGVAITGLYPEDRTLKTLKRIMTNPVSEGQYIFAQGIFTFCSLYIPTYIAVATAKIFLGNQFIYGFDMLAMLLAILVAFTTAFALFISSIVKENIQLTASVIAITTSLLGGCFIAFSPQNVVLKAICAVIPQKHFMDMLDGIAQGKVLLDFIPQLTYILLCVLLLGATGVYVIKNTAKKAASK